MEFFIEAVRYSAEGRVTMPAIPLPDPAPDAYCVCAFGDDEGVTVWFGDFPDLHRANEYVRLMENPPINPVAYRSYYVCPYCDHGWNSVSAWRDCEESCPKCGDEQEYEPVRSYGI